MESWDFRTRAERHWLVREERLGLLRSAGRRRRGRGRGRIRRRSVQSRVGARLLFDGRLLVDREELAFLSKTNTVLASALRIVGCNETSDLPSSAVYCRKEEN